MRRASAAEVEMSGRASMFPAAALTASRPGSTPRAARWWCRTPAGGHRRCKPRRCRRLGRRPRGQACRRSRPGRPPRRSAARSPGPRRPGPSQLQKVLLSGLTNIDTTLKCGRVSATVSNTDGSHTQTVASAFTDRVDGSPWKCKRGIPVRRFPRRFHLDNICLDPCRPGVSAR